MKKGWSHDGGYVDMPGSPLYPFGYGLSYTKFRYSNLHIDTPQTNPSGKVKVTVDVQNTGERPGTETVQLYLHERYAPVSRRGNNLRGLERARSNSGGRSSA